MKNDFLWTAWKEDRTEIRLIRDRIYSICTFITVASFAVSAFLLGKDRSFTKEWSPLFFFIDVSFVALLCTIFFLLKKDLTNARKCLELREKLIRDHLASGAECRDPFLPAITEKPRIKENGLYFVACLAVLAILVKSLVVYQLLRDAGTVIM